MERALLEVEHNNELKSIQNDEAKLKQLQHEHQAKLDGFARHTNQIRDEIEMIQMTIKNIENEILILDTSLDASAHYDTLRAQKEHSLDEAKHIHEDLEFQLMELEAKYETELEDIQNRLISEQDNLLRIFRQRQTSLSEYDQQQTQMLLRVKAETEQLEMERLKLIDEFKRQKDLLQNVEKKMNRLVIQMQKQSSDELINIQDLSLTGSSSSSTSSSNQQQQEQTPSPASSSVSLSSTSNNSNSEASTSSSSAVNSLSTNTTTSTTSPSSSSTSSQTTSHKEQELPGKLVSATLLTLFKSSKLIFVFKVDETTTGVCLFTSISTNHIKLSTLANTNTESLSRLVSVGQLRQFESFLFIVNESTTHFDPTAYEQ